jgi:hypothetical protein
MLSNRKSFMPESEETGSGITKAVKERLEAAFYPVISMVI